MNTKTKNESSLRVIECSYCQTRIGTTQDRQPPKVAICPADACQTKYSNELAECFQEAKEERVVDQSKPNRQRKSRKKQFEWTAPEGQWIKDVWSGPMLVKIYMNQIDPQTTAYKCRLYRKLPEHYTKSLSDSVPEASLNDAMRAMYRAQRFIRERRRGFALWRVLLPWLP